MPLSCLLEKNFKIRAISLKHNVVTDEGAQLLVQALVNNEYIVRLNLEMNPLRHSILEDIEKHTSANQMKVTN